MSIEKIKELAIKENWHTLPKDSPEHRVYELAQTPVIENKIDEGIVKPDVPKPVEFNKPKKKGKKK